MARKEPEKDPGRPLWQRVITTIIMVALLLFLLRSCGVIPRGVLPWEAAEEEIIAIEASEFYTQLQEDKVAEVVINAQEKVIVSGEYKTGEGFTTYCSYSSDLHSDLGKLLHEKGVRIIEQPPPRTSGWITFLSFLPFLLIGAIMFFIIRRAMKGAGGIGFGKSRAKLFDPMMTRTTFDDVAGVEEAKQELQEIVEFLKDQEKFMALGARIPKGVLLMGPPGTGKTLLARAVAGEAEVPFFSISASEFVEMFVGVGASRVRDLFDKAKQVGPSIIFIDEIDVVGRQREVKFTTNEEGEQTLQQILTEMDGFDIDTKVIVLAATNRPEILDPALRRPGRFDRQVILDRPDITGREAILKVHTRGKPLDETCDLGIIAKQTSGFCGAELANLMNEAAILAVKRNKTRISMQELEESIDKVIAGPERKSKKISPEEKKTTAYHEAGHALVARKLPKADPVHKISIVARGLMGGYTRLLSGDRYLLTRSQFSDMMAVLLGGYVAEELIFGEVSTGPGNDLERATEMSYEMVTEYGMSKELGPRTFGRRQRSAFLGQKFEERNYSEKTAQEIDKEVQRFINSALKEAQRILEENRSKLEQIAERLLIEETIEGEALEQLFNEPVE